MIEAALAFALILTNLGWLWYMDRQSKRSWDERSELTSRIQHPTLVNPRVAQEPPPKPISPEPDPREWAGTVQAYGVDGDGG